jgi:hypothetical protein
LTITSALRGRASGFSLAVIVIADSPCPDVGEICSQAPSPRALQVHSRSAETVTLALPPAAGIVGDGVEKEVRHRVGFGPPSSVTVVPPQPAAMTARTKAEIVVLLSPIRTPQPNAFRRPTA